MGTKGGKSDDEYSYIGDKGDIGFIDFDNDKSICEPKPDEESEMFSISAPFPFVEGKPQWGYVRDVICDSVTINNLTNEPLDVWSISIYDSKPADSFTLSIMKPPSKNSEEQYVKEFVESFSLEDRVLRSGQSLTIWLSCKPKEIGVHTSAIHFSVGDEIIERVVFVMAEDRVSQSLAPGKPYNRSRKKKQPANNVCTGDAYVKGSRPSKAANRSFKNRLPLYPIPADVRSFVEIKEIPVAIQEHLTEKTYASYFKTLLFMEEIKMEEDMRDYNMECVPMKSKGGHFLTLEVPGLAERRPSLAYGDYVFARLASQDAGETKAYQGYIHRVEAEEVFLKFDRDFHIRHRPDNLYNVQFTYNRVSFRRIYQAIEVAEKLGTELLFPSSESSKKRSIQGAQLVPLSSSLNEEQMSAVQMILGCRGGSPYVIHGPPGTGKTMTLVETILQLYTRQKRAKILVCAPSNSAADHVLEKLLSEKAVNIRNHEIFRLNAITRPYDDISPDLLEFCYAEEFEFRCPPGRDLVHYKIIISTYTSASLLYAEGIKQGHFSHIFLDEAGQASEPQTMVPLSLYQGNTVVVLAGDPMQLGPVVFSKEAESYGLGKSYLERLFEYKVYREKNESYITKLVRNYRSHPAILHLPSELFYRGELISCKESDTVEGNSWMDLLLNKEFPLLLIGVQGCDEREGSNPSWFNRIEASKVVEIIKNLIEHNGVSENDIGVITPYRQQVLKIRKALESFNSFNIKVGSVEQFQGQEKKIILVSTVRSTIKHNEFDKAHYLGFLSNPRRFNVAITRARSLLIVIGNPHIICKDRYWNKLLWYCHENNSYKGCFLPEKRDIIEEETAAPPSEMPDWGQDSSWADENDENQQPSNEMEDWGQDSTQFKYIPEPVGGEAEWSDDWNDSSQVRDNLQPYQTADWGQDSFQVADNLQPSEMADWGQNSSQVTENFQPSGMADWGQDSSQVTDHLQPSEMADWGEDSSQVIENLQPSETADWGQDSSQIIDNLNGLMIGNNQS